MVQNGKGEGKLALITIGVCFIGLLFQLTMPKLKLFSQENKPDAIYGLATMAEYRLVSDLPLILRPEWGPKAWIFFFWDWASRLSQGLDDYSPTLSEVLDPRLLVKSFKENPGLGH